MKVMEDDPMIQKMTRMTTKLTLTMLTMMMMIDVKLAGDDNEGGELVK